MNLSRKWEADWGGLLQLTDEVGHVSETLMPCFNAPNLFSVPRWHCLPYVAP